jgi:hypothetical protein
MYDPLWSTAKLVSAVGEGLAAVAAVPLVIVLRGPIRAGHGVAAGGSPRATALR